ncbi:HlyD family secretion protein [Legionella spiritensis]|uniref:HlyD family secretion protein n=2 Tax=Legionella spiritensis TaxID=452 RepID=A0A0W0YYC6_LEGSP|nr:HlyD family secretion protein [Legionella spiritensis]SNV31186.1 HlyD family secretion protein [Legionella spiritensis]
MKKAMTVKKNIIIPVLFIAILAAVSAWFVNDYLRRERQENWLILYGNVDIRDVALSFRVSGRLKTMNVEEGDHVNEGTVIALLDKDTFIADLNMAKAELAQASASEQNARRTFRRRSRLVKDGAVSKALYDDAIAQRDEAIARTATAKARVARAEIALNDTEIHSPTNGTILTRVREPGAVVTETQPVYTLAIDSPVWVRTYVPEPDLGRIYPGQEALVFTDSNPDNPYKGHVGFISPQAEFTPKTVETTELRTDLVYRLRVVVNNPDNGLRQGMPVTVKIHLNQHQDHEPQ